MADNDESNFKLKKDFGISDFFVDFLGALIPGLLFGVTLLITCGSSLAYLIHQFRVIILINKCNSDIDTIGIISSISKGIGSFSWYLVVLVLISSYVLGQFLYRKDPNKADTASLIRIWKDMPLGQKETWVERVTENDNKDFKASYPYKYLKEYLKARKFDYLAQFIPWEGNEKDIGAKSTQFINSLKIRIQFFHPDKMGDIIKNEAHSRLMGSIWHLLRYMKYISSICLVTNILIFSLELFWPTWTSLYLIVPSLLSSLVLLFATMGKREIEKFIHFQRVREIFYVLETAYIASINEKKIFNKKNATER